MKINSACTSFHLCIFTESESLELEGNLEGHLVQLTYNEQGHLQIGNFPDWNLLLTNLQINKDEKSPSPSGTRAVAQVHAEPCSNHLTVRSVNIPQAGGPTKLGQTGVIKHYTALCLSWKYIFLLPFKCVQRSDFSLPALLCFCFYLIPQYQEGTSFPVPLSHNTVIHAAVQG